MKAFLACLVTLGFALPAWGQPKNWEKEWNEVLAAAKKEGTVVIAGSPDPVMRKEVIPKFSSRFGIGVEFVAGRSSEIVARIRTERAAGVYSMDLFMAGPDTTASSLYGEKMVDPVKPLLILPEVLDGSKWKTGKPMFIDPEEKFVLRLFRTVADFLFINTDYVKPEEMRSSMDLLNPKWRGKISAEDPLAIGAGANLAGYFLMQQGEDYLRKLYIDQKPMITRERRQFTDWLARGTAPICLNCRKDDVAPLVKEGFHFQEIFELTDVPARTNGSPWLLTLANKAPHPNAARVFANWIASKEGLEIYARGYGSAGLRTDIDESYLAPGTIPRPGVKYFDDADWNWILTGRQEAREKAWKALKGQ